MYLSKSKKGKGRERGGEVASFLGYLICKVIAPGHKIKEHWWPLQCITFALDRTPDASRSLRMRGPLVMGVLFVVRRPLSVHKE